MISLRLLTRNATPQLVVSTQRLHTSKIFNSESSDSDSSDDEKRKRKPVEAKKEDPKRQSVHKLNSLLQSMITQSKTPSKVNVALSPKKPKRVNQQVVRSSQSVTGKLFEEKLAGAAKDVAASLGGDTGRTESELLKKILTPNVADQKPIKLGKLMSGMNVDREKPKPTGDTGRRADQVRTAMQRQGTPYKSQMNQPRTMGKYLGETLLANSRVDLDAGTPLNLFNANTEAKPDPNTPALATWDLLEKKEFKILVTHPPKNFIEQMIQWTEQGRLWRFPIDNEQDLTIDQEEHFSEHIFLEQHLEDWCPTKGPIRHFMELVCVGLSKNPYLSAKEKREHIVWFKEYFDGKKDLLKELGAYGMGDNNAGKKQIEA